MAHTAKEMAETNCVVPEEEKAWISDLSPFSAFIEGRKQLDDRLLRQLKDRRSRRILLLKEIRRKRKRKKVA